MLMHGENEAPLLPNEPDDYTFEDWMRAWRNQMARSMPLLFDNYDPSSLTLAQTGNMILRLLPFEVGSSRLSIVVHKDLAISLCAGCGQPAVTILDWLHDPSITDRYSRFICDQCRLLLEPLLARSAQRIARYAICLLLSGPKTTLSRGIIMHHWRRCEWCRSRREMRAADIIYGDHCYFICCRCIGQLERLGRVMIDYSAQHIFSCVAPLIAGELLPKDVGLYLAGLFLEAHGKWLVAADMM